MTVAQGTPRTDALKTYLREKYPDTFFGQLKDVYYMEAAELFAQECVMLEAENAALSAQVVELQQEKEEQFLADAAEMTKYVNQIVELQKQLHSTVTRASVPPSVSDGGTHEELFQSALDTLERDAARFKELE